MVNQYVQDLLAAKLARETPRSKEAQDAGAALVCGTGTVAQYLAAKAKEK
jgi:hypothetical protein